jgi:hypothetical protein
MQSLLLGPVFVWLFLFRCDPEQIVATVADLAATALGGQSLWEAPESCPCWTDVCDSWYEIRVLRGGLGPMLLHDCRDQSVAGRDEPIEPTADHGPTCRP